MTKAKERKGGVLLRDFLSPIVTFLSWTDDSLYTKMLIRDGDVHAYNRKAFIKAAAPFDTGGYDILVPRILYLLARGIPSDELKIDVSLDKVVLSTEFDNIIVNTYPGEDYVSLPDMPGVPKKWVIRIAKVPLRLCSKDDYVTISEHGLEVVNRAYILQMKTETNMSGSITVRNADIRRAASVGRISEFAVQGNFLMLKSGVYTMGVPRISVPFSVDVEDISRRIKDRSFAHVIVDLERMWDTINVMSKITRNLQFKLCNNRLSIIANGMFSSMERRLPCEVLSGVDGETVVSAIIVGRIFDKKEESASHVWLSRNEGLIIESDNYALIVPSLFLD